MGLAGNIDNKIKDVTDSHRRMARGAFGLPKVSLRPDMAYLLTPRGRATFETAKVGGLRPSL
jgi:carbohydrate-selective porin OprB